MKKIKYYKDDIILVSILVGLSALFYLVHFLIFRDTHHISIFGLSDFAFMPIEVIVVSLILHRVIAINEKKKRQGKVYMIIEVFFTELGFDLLKLLAVNDRRIEAIQDSFVMDENWSRKTMIKNIRNYKSDLQLNTADYREIFEAIDDSESKIERLIENPLLIEHDVFSELLMAIFHLYKGLYKKKAIKKMSAHDLERFKRDVERVYEMLCIEWIEYLHHTKTHYPDFLEAYSD